MLRLIDTDIAIHLRDEEPAVSLAMRRAGAFPALSVVTRVELENGVAADTRRRAVRRLSLDEMLAEMKVLDFGSPEATAYRAIVERTGFSRPRILDRMIAATALVHKLTLVTRNPRDFADIDGLAIESW